ncbi:MAG: chaperone modulator CbpM [gamma proteobacterium symbiont of Bathyaustriella thionipta]|nr:chaperone modulator CbpM [gamma proteobacterium symbiont of Bathyaustriella thionipta]
MQVTIYDDDTRLSTRELCHICNIPADMLIELVEYGILEPFGPTPAEWNFSQECIGRVQASMRLQHELEINLPAIALVLEMREQIRALRKQLALSGGHH